MAKTLTELLHGPSAAAADPPRSETLKPVIAPAPTAAVVAAPVDRVTMLNQLATAYGASSATLSAAIASGASSDAFAIRVVQEKAARDDLEATIARIEAA
ncbi:hypothetical protein D3Y57_02475 (plasmid) [Sphingomonas paeninsulae]|uniref:Uncharacterized protein n=1 Tax=Sphingomonas paeninsulae TaxID=2319844 RepID=A0A494TCZ3_SPHPE|nr:hypothetical protein [Sphingomonas paeninsulae]AYJ84943.1 hypothetical protein D3Y57_02475 [Sphingomonas paeninsulae]